VLRKKIEGFPMIIAPSLVLVRLASLYGIIGNHAEQASFLNHALKLERERGNDYGVALALKELSDANRFARPLQGRDRSGEGSVGIFERLGETGERAECLSPLLGC
jgi:hypothetical protein